LKGNSLKSTSAGIVSRWRRGGVDGRGSEE
jgi:hypothetical protein